MAVKKITRRWLFNSFGVIVVIILILEVAFGIGISNYYYNSVYNALLSRADLINSVFTQYAEDRTADFRTQVRDYVAAFPAKGQMEMLVLDSQGEVLYPSSGFTPDDTSIPQDYLEALASADRAGSITYRADGQRVMALTLLLTVQEPGSASAVSAVRLVTSLDNVDRQILLLILSVSLLGVAVLLMVLFSSSYFINSIVNPVGEVGDTARKIASGDFGARLQKKNDDEIGELCDIINYMAEELGAAEQLKNDFISSVSHELRTPLTAIQGWGETLLADDGQDKEILRRGMRIIIGETGRLAQMVEELLDFSRMQSGRLKLIMTRIDPLAELDEAVMMYTERARRDSIELLYLNGSDGPDGTQADLVAPVRGDKNKLRQVFVNVIDNAIKYSDPGGRVTVGAEVKAGALVITVSDTGIGIRDEDLERVKQKFFKADSTRRGSGIGLAVADEIITRHGGSLSLESEYGAGTAVTITLPLAGREEATQIDAAQLPEHTQSPTDQA